MSRPPGLVVALGLNGGGRRIGEVAVDRAIAVVHGTDEAARPTLLLSLALEAAAVAGLMAVGVTISAPLPLLKPPAPAWLPGFSGAR